VRFSLKELADLEIESECATLEEELWLCKVADLVVLLPAAIVGGLQNDNVAAMIWRQSQIVWTADENLRRCVERFTPAVVSERSPFLICRKRFRVLPAACPAQPESGDVCGRMLSPFARDSLR